MNVVQQWIHQTVKGLLYIGIGFAGGAAVASLGAGFLIGLPAELLGYQVPDSFYPLILYGGGAIGAGNIIGQEVE